MLCASLGMRGGGRGGSRQDARDCRCPQHRAGRWGPRRAWVGARHLCVCVCACDAMQDCPGRACGPRTAGPKLWHSATGCRLQPVLAPSLAPCAALTPEEHLCSLSMHACHCRGGWLTALTCTSLLAHLHVPTCAPTCTPQPAHAPTLKPASPGSMLKLPLTRTHTPIRAHTHTHTRTCTHAYTRAHTRTHTHARTNTLHLTRSTMWGLRWPSSRASRSWGWPLPCACTRCAPFGGGEPRGGQG